MGFIVRVAHYGALLTMIGAVVFPLFVVRRALQDGDAASRIDRMSARIGLVAAIAFICASALRLVLQLDSMRFPGEPLGQSVGPVLQETTWGKAWLVQISTAVASFLFFAFARRWRGSLTAAAVTTALAALTLPLSGHAIAASPSRFLAVLSDSLHVLGAGAWLGTAFVMLITHVESRRATAGVDSHTGARHLRALVRSFSPLALICAGVVVASGLLSTLMHVPSVTQLFASSYGRTLCLKVLFVIGVFVAGWYNWKRNTPSAESDGGSGLRRGIVLELVATTLVVLATSALVVTPPPGE